MTNLITHPRRELIEQPDKLVRRDVCDEALHEAVHRVAVGVVEPQRDEPEHDDVMAPLLRPGQRLAVVGERQFQELAPLTLGGLHLNEWLNEKMN